MNAFDYEEGWVQEDKAVALKERFGSLENVEYESLLSAWQGQKHLERCGFVLYTEDREAEASEVSDKIDAWVLEIQAEVEA